MHWIELLDVAVLIAVDPIAACVSSTNKYGASVALPPPEFLDVVEAGAVQVVAPCSH